MNNFRKEMPPVSEEVIKTIENIANPKWAIPFLGRKLNLACKNQFKDAEIKGFSLELPWEGQVKYERHNGYDESTYVHELVVTVYSEGPAAGRIKTVQAHHWEHWHTTSNWQDHSESHSYDKREPTEQEIKKYMQLLEGWTEGGSSEQIRALSECLVSIVRRQSGKIQVEFGKCYDGGECYKSIVITFFSEELLRSTKIVINLDHLVEALDYSRIYIEVIHSREDRKRLGICRNESWTLQYFLNFFNIYNTKELYQNIELSLRAWLYRIYSSCSYYRDFMGLQSDTWWRDAWWRLQEVVEGRNRVVENKDLFATNCSNSGCCDIEQFLDNDPFRDLVGKITICKQKFFIRPFLLDSPSGLFYFSKGQPVRKEPEYVIMNGIKWAIYPQSNYETIIDLSDSEEVEELKDGTAIIPYKISTYVVTEVCVSKESLKNWRKVVFAAPQENDLCLYSDYIDESDDIDESWFDDTGYEDSVCERDEYQSQRYEKGLTICDGVFRGWQMLEEVLCKRKYCYLENYAFEACTKLRNINTEDNFVRISARCFQSCSALEDVGCLNVNEIEVEAFKDCVALRSVVIRCKSALSLGEFAFVGCSALESVKIENFEINDDGCSLPRGAFLGCLSLRELHLPKWIRILEEECLAGCSPDLVIHYEGDVFWFIGEGALPKLKNIFYWGKSIIYERKKVVLSSLIDELDIKREQYVQTYLDYQETGRYSISQILAIIEGKECPSHSTHEDCYNDFDYKPSTYDDAYEIYGSRLYDA